jgi:hypothetical protein
VWKANRGCRQESGTALWQVRLHCRLVRQNEKDCEVRGGPNLQHFGKCAYILHHGKSLLSLSHSMKRSGHLPAAVVVPGR